MYIHVHVDVRTWYISIIHVHVHGFLSLFFYMGLSPTRSSSFLYHASGVVILCCLV